jgi:hypothetical protein
MCYFETSGCLRTTRHYNPEDRVLHDKVMSIRPQVQGILNQVLSSVDSDYERYHVSLLKRNIAD